MQKYATAAAFILLITCLWLLQPVNIEQQQSAKTGNVTIMLQNETAISTITGKQADGVYVPHYNAIKIATRDSTRGKILYVCGHEMQHHHLSESGIDPKEHHRIMNPISNLYNVPLCTYALKSLIT